MDITNTILTSPADQIVELRATLSGLAGQLAQSERERVALRVALEEAKLEERTAQHEIAALASAKEPLAQLSAAISSLPVVAALAAAIDKEGDRLDDVESLLEDLGRQIERLPDADEVHDLKRSIERLPDEDSIADIKSDIEELKESAALDEMKASISSLQRDADVAQDWIDKLADRMCDVELRNINLLSSADNRLDVLETLVARMMGVDKAASETDVVTSVFQRLANLETSNQLLCAALDNATQALK